ncbi:MAG: hypothetical protein WCB68_18195 [Pyrinomonadaceae bacterium]
MSHRLFNKFKALSIMVFILGTVTAVLAYSINHIRSIQQAKGFTIISRETFAPAGPNVKLPEVAYVITVRYQKSDGTWKMIRTNHSSDGKVMKEDIGFGKPGRGVFQIDQKTGNLNFISPMSMTSGALLYDWRKDSQFVREDSVFGYRAFVVRRTDDDGSAYTETYYAPDLDNYPIKEVYVSPMGTATTEPTRIEKGDPDEKVFSSLPDSPVKYEQFEKKIRAMEEMGRHDAAEKMRQELQQRLQSKIDK